MKKQRCFPKKLRGKSIISLIMGLLIILGAILPAVQATNLKYYNGFDKGPSFKPVLPLKKVTLVGFDEESYLDDYAYLAAVPTAVFKEQNGNRLFSHPLLFFQEELDIENESHKSLDAYQGIKYFMEDWMQYSNDQLDQMILINVPKNVLDDEWDAKEYITVIGNDLYKIASEIALNDWSYSNSIILAIVDDEVDQPDNKISDKIERTINFDKEIIEKSFKTEKLNLLNPRFHEFDVPEGYKYLKTRTWWPSMWVGTGGSSDLPININITIPSADPDSQLYCKYNGEWMQVAATAGWNLLGMDQENAESYIYSSGDWKLGITDVPTQGNFFGLNGKPLDVIKNMIGKTEFQTDITLYPGIEIEIPIKPTFGCRDATFKLTWDNSRANLGFSIIGPSGEEVLSSSEEGQNYQELHLDQIGECLEDEHYSLSVFALNDISGQIKFEVEYSWEQKYSKHEADSLTSATEGAVLASTLNAPMIYTSSNTLSEDAKNVLYKLGVENIYLVNIGSHLSKEVKDELKEIANVKKEYNQVEDIYKEIMDLTGQNDIIFSTIDPWTQWYIEACKPAEETKAALFIGPSAYCAAHHGSPVIIVDNHPELSSAVVGHTEFWKRNGDGHHEPSIAMMHLTGKKVYELLDRLNFDKKDAESMITVAGQYDIGATWDRTFTGKAKPGRFFGSPVDTAYQISRSVFYPALVFNNPAMNIDGADMIQGSSSERRKLLPWGAFGLEITEESKTEKVKYPALHTYICYMHNMNEIFDKYYDFKYKTADDITPGFTESFDSIDENAVPGKEGSVWPDISGSEVPPFYLEKGGFGNAFSTSYSAITENLNNGVLVWISGTHGAGQGSGRLLTWDPDDSTFGSFPNIISKRFGYTKESNPWRGYDWYLGSTANPDTLTMESHGFLPALLGNPNIDGLFPIGMDFWPSERPILHGIANLPIIKRLVPEWLKDSDYYKDGTVISSLFGISATTIKLMTGYSLDKVLKNVHSCGWINSACLPAYKYMHLAMIRHGSSFQVIDPWVTSWYAYWALTMPRDIVLGDTVGEAYTKGISHVGILYVGGAGPTGEDPQWWWDTSQNVCFFGDPDQRLYVPNTDHSDANHWNREETKPYPYDETLSVKGHMPFGATSHPNEKQPKILFLEYLWLVILIIIIIIGLVIIKNKKFRKK